MNWDCDLHCLGYGNSITLKGKVFCVILPKQTITHLNCQMPFIWVFWIPLYCNLEFDWLKQNKLDMIHFLTKMLFQRNQHFFATESNFWPVPTQVDITVYSWFLKVTFNWYNSKKDDFATLEKNVVFQTFWKIKKT